MSAATIVELRCHLNRAQRCAEYLAIEAPAPQREGYGSIVELLSNAHRILGEISEVDTVRRAQSDLDSLRAYAAKREQPFEAAKVETSYIEPDDDDDDDEDK